MRSINTIKGAVRNGHYHIVEYLFKQGTSVDTELLNVAIANGHFDIVTLLVELGVNLAEKFCGLTPLMIAQYSSQTKIANYIQEQLQKKSEKELGSNPHFLFAKPSTQKLSDQEEHQETQGFKSDKKK